MSVSIPESFRFFFTTPTATGTFPPVIEACSTMNFTFTTITGITESPSAPYTPVFYVQENGGKTPYSFAGPGIGSSQAGTYQLPFNNSQAGTQFVTCMFSANGQTGGCQNVFTVIPAAEDCAIPHPAGFASWPAVPQEKQLPMSMQSPSADTGKLTDVGQFSGWPQGCTDIHFEAKGGKAPYTLTVAAAYAPPRNYTYDSPSFQWTIDLSRAFPFFVSVFDSSGLSYTAGPLHVGGGGSTKCLAASSGGPGLSTTVTAGVAVAALVVGALLAFAAALGYKKYRIKHPIPLFSPVDEPNFVPTPFVSSHLDRSGSLRDGRDRAASLLGHSTYARVDASDVGDDDARSPPPGSTEFGSRSTRAATGGYTDPYNPRQSMHGSSSGGWSDHKDRRRPKTAGESEDEMEMGSRRAGGQRGEREGLMGRNVFVVHHDGGGAPVTVFTDAGTEVVELPPSYLNASPVTEGSAGSRRSSPGARRQSLNSPPTLGRPTQTSPTPTTKPLPPIEQSSTSAASLFRPDPFVTPPVETRNLPASSSDAPSSWTSPPARTTTISPPPAPHPSGPNRAVSRMSSGGPGAPAQRMSMGGPRPLSGPRAPPSR